LITVASALIAGVAAISSIVVLAQFYCDGEKLGGVRSWTDATYALAQSAELHDSQVVYHLDWGLDQTLHLLSRGTLPQRGRDRVSEDTIREGGAVFLRWSPGNEYFPGVAEKLDDSARAFGYTHEAIRVFFDRHDRPMVELFQYRRSPTAK